MRQLQLLFKSKSHITFTLLGLVAATTLLAAMKMLNLSSTTSLIPKRSDATSFHGPRIIPMDASFLSLIENSMSNMSAWQLEHLYFSITRHSQIDCLNSHRIGKPVDGGWDVCFTRPFNISQVRGRPCVAFSFGINNVFEYDDSLADNYNCHVYMFDPSMTKVENHQRKKTSWFYKIGLGSSNSVQQTTGWTMRTLCTLFKQFGFEGSQIDIVKVDIELWEWESFEAALSEGCLSRVSQLLFESHTDELVKKRANYQRMIRVWLGLFKAGFRTWQWHENPHSRFFKSVSGDQRACCHEHYMLNIAYL